jgi:hypothetical protein
MLPLPETHAGSAYMLPKAPGRVDWTLGSVPGRGGRWKGHTGGKILTAHIYRKEKK